MANIIGLHEQQAALKEIGDILKVLAKTNEFLAAQNMGAEYTISFNDAEGKKHTTTLTGTKEEINTLVLRCKEEKKNYILNKAKEFRIGLEPEDKEILGISD